MQYSLFPKEIKQTILANISDLKDIRNLLLVSKEVNSMIKQVTTKIVDHDLSVGLAFISLFKNLVKLDSNVWINIVDDLIDLLLYLVSSKITCLGIEIYGYTFEIDDTCVYELTGTSPRYLGQILLLIILPFWKRRPFNFYLQNEHPLCGIFGDIVLVDQIDITGIMKIMSTVKPKHIASYYFYYNCHQFLRENPNLVAFMDSVTEEYDNPISNQLGFEPSYLETIHAAFKRISL